MIDNKGAGNAGTQPQNTMERTIEQREAAVLGSGPRLEPLPVEELTDDLLNMILQMIQVNDSVESRQKETLTDLMADLGTGAPTPAVASQIANLPEIMRTMLRHPELFACQTEVSIQLLRNGALSARDRELAILRIGWLCQAPYEWGEHVHIAKNAGVTSDEIELVTRGSNAPGWGEHEQAIVRAAEELFDNAMISDATWSTLAKRLDEKQLIELPIVIGQYQTVAYVQNSLRLRLHTGNLGLKAR